MTSASMYRASRAAMAVAGLLTAGLAAPSVEACNACKARRTEAAASNEVAAAKSGEREANLAWSFRLHDVDGTATLDLSAIRIVFVGVKLTGTASGSVRISGSGRSTIKTGAGGAYLTQVYRDGVNTLTFGDHTLRLMESGRKLSINDKTFELDDKPRHIDVQPDGRAAIRPEPVDE